MVDVSDKFFYILSDSRELEGFFQLFTYPVSSISRECIDIVNLILYRAIVIITALSDDGSSSTLLNGNIVTTFGC